MVKKFGILILLFANSIFITALIVLYNNVMVINYLWLTIIILWILISSLIRNEDRKKAGNKYTIFILVGLVLSINSFLVYNIPQFTYKEACQIVILDEYKMHNGNSKVEALDNKNIKHFAISTNRHNLIEYKLYIIVLKDDKNQKNYWFDPYTGKYQDFKLDNLPQ